MFFFPKRTIKVIVPDVKFQNIANCFYQTFNNSDETSFSVAVKTFQPCQKERLDYGFLLFRYKTFSINNHA